MSGILNMSMIRDKAARRLRIFTERLQPKMTTIEFDTLAEFIEVGFCRNIIEACPGIEADFVDNNWKQLKELIWNVDEGIDVVFMDDITITKIKEIVLVVIQRITRDHLITSDESAEKLKSRLIGSFSGPGYSSAMKEALIEAAESGAIFMTPEKDMYAVENDDIVRIADVIQHSYYGINSEKRSMKEQLESNKKHFQNISGALRKR